MVREDAARERSNGMMKSSSYFTLIMVICPICSISRWTSICFMLWPNFRILLIVASSLGR
ncbi:hypothetical protein Gotri_006038 [Gossypium trilobum]|uniref:Uncharacterized protein n=1 Tax=Gossypium trilobum TaxID=34281 RepID=A0A7J9F0H6_9ROSI|nr:hypothetical protein [Gossypium trilobum]